MSTRCVVAIDAIGDRLEPTARHVDRRAVGEMAARREIEAHERVARLHQREEHALIGLAAGIGLDVREAQPNNWQARSIASFSAMSTNWQPP